MVGGRHHVEPGRAGEPGLHPVGAGIAAEQAVVVADDLGAELQFADVEKAGALGKVVQQRAGDHRHVARRGVVLGIVQPVRVDEMQFVQADLLRLGVHLRREGVHRTRHALGDGHGDVVWRLHHQHLEGVVERDLGAGPEAHLRGRLARRARRDDERRVHGQPAGAHRVERDIDRHQLGQRRGIPDLGRVLLEQHLSAVGVDDEIGSRCRRRMRTTPARRRRPADRSKKRQKACHRAPSTPKAPCGS